MYNNVGKAVGDFTSPLRWCQLHSIQTSSHRAYAYDTGSGAHIQDVLGSFCNWCMEERVRLFRVQNQVDKMHSLQALKLLLITRSPVFTLADRLVAPSILEIPFVDGRCDGCRIRFIGTKSRVSIVQGFLVVLVYIVRMRVYRGRSVLTTSSNPSTWPSPTVLPVVFTAVTASAALSSPCAGTTELVALTISFGGGIVAASVTGELPLTAAAGGRVDSLSAIIVLNIQRAVVQQVRVVRQFLAKGRASQYGNQAFSPRRQH